MRIRILQKAVTASIEGMRIDHFQVGVCYDVGTTLATLLLAEGWAEPAPIDGPPPIAPSNEPDPDALQDHLTAAFGRFPGVPTPEVVADKVRRGRRKRRARDRT